MKGERRQIHFPGFVAAGAAIVVVSIAAYPQPQMGLHRLLQPGLWPSVAIAGLAVILMAWLARLVFVLTRAWLAVRRLPRAERHPAPLSASIARTRAGRVRCIAGTVPVAFCAGVVRPEIVVSEGLAGCLSDPELDAVLLHERHHMRRREPLVRAAAQAAAQVLFFFPLARWWCRRRTEEAELRADQAAVREVGPGPVAAALCSLESTVRSEAAFTGVADLRVAQLLGDPLPVQRPAAAVIAWSILGPPFALLVVASAVVGAARILGL